MIKLKVLGLICAMLTAGPVCAQESIRLGAGGYFGSDFGGGYQIKYGVDSVALKLPYVGGGGFLFFDAIYAELAVGFFAGSGDSIAEISSGSTVSASEDYSISNLNISLLAKYPIELSYAIIFFPLLGADYALTLSCKDKDGKPHKNSAANEDIPPGHFSAVWFKAGCGLDFAITDNLFLRGEVLYGIRLANKTEKDEVDYGKEQLRGTGADIKTSLGHGLNVKLALGYMF